MIDIIESVKIQGDGYLVNNKYYVPKDTSNRYYHMVKEWIDCGNIPESEFTEDELHQQEVIKIIYEARQYLKDTDWYYAREAETGEPIPQDVRNKRIEARNVLRAHGY